MQRKARRYAVAKLQEVEELLGALLLELNWRSEKKCTVKWYAM